MSGRPAWWSRAFGDDAISIWSWLLTLPFAVTVMAGYEFVQDARPVYRGFLVALTVHLLLGLVLLVLRYTVLRPGFGRYRGATALASFAAIGVARPLLIVLVAGLYGVHVVPGDLVSRVTINLVSAVVLLPLIAVVVGVLREHGDVQRRLLTARAAVAERRTDADRRVDDLQSEYAATVIARIDAAISAEEDDPDPDAAAALLRRLSDDIVRPASHALFHDEAPGGAPSGSALHLPNGARLRRVATGLRPAPPLTLTGVYLALVFPHFLSTYGLAVTVLQTPIVGAVYLLGNTITGELASRIRSTAGRIATLIACYLGVALLAAALTAAALHLFGFSPEFYWSELASYPFVAIVIAVIRSVSVQLRADEDELAASLRDEVDLAARAQRRLSEARRGMAQLLHSTVQAELIATSLSLRSGDGLHSAGERSAAEVVALTVAGIKHDLANRSRPETTDARDSVEGVIAMWGSALRIATYIDDDVWHLLAAEPGRRDAVIDVLSEGFTNAVRHGTGTAVAAAVTLDGATGRVVVEVRSQGTLPTASAAPDPGIGLDRMRSAGTTSIRSEADHVVLTVTLD